MPAYLVKKQRTEEIELLVEAGSPEAADETAWFTGKEVSSRTVEDLTLSVELAPQ